MVLERIGFSIPWRLSVLMCKSHRTSSSLARLANPCESLVSKGLYLRSTKHLRLTSVHAGRGFCSQVASITPDEDILKDDSDLKDTDYMLPENGHQVIVIHPEIKWKRGGVSRQPVEAKLSEACALVDSLPKWNVANQIVTKVKNTSNSHVFGPGQLEMLRDKVKMNDSCSAIFVNMKMLTGLQLATLQKFFHIPVYDRYTIVLQIFMARAQTMEAKLQVALAELPYLKSRLRGMHLGTLDRQAGGLASVGGAGETFLSKRRKVLQERESKLIRALKEMEGTRSIIRQARLKKEIPVIAIVGYTNAGKTSLIKALSDDTGIEPRNQLFATLDVTVHPVTLPNSMKVLFIDTVGFMSDLPTALIQSFKSTLEEINLADGVIHVQDVSNPDFELQAETVHTTLESLKLPESLHQNTIEIFNKVDKVEQAPQRDGVLNVSAMTGEGLQELQLQIQDICVAATGRVHKLLKVPMKGGLVTWLHKETTVVKAEPFQSSSEHLLVESIMTAKVYGQLKKKFKRIKQSC